MKMLHAGGVRSSGGYLASVWAAAVLNEGKFQTSTVASSQQHTCEHDGRLMTRQGPWDETQETSGANGRCAGLTIQCACCGRLTK